MLTLPLANCTELSASIEFTSKFICTLLVPCLIYRVSSSKSGRAYAPIVAEMSRGECCVLSSRVHYALVERGLRSAQSHGIDSVMRFRKALIVNRVPGNGMERNAVASPLSQQSRRVAPRRVAIRLGGGGRAAHWVCFALSSASARKPAASGVRFRLCASGCASAIARSQSHTQPQPQIA